MRTAGPDPKRTYVSLQLAAEMGRNRPRTCASRTSASMTFRMEPDGPLPVPFLTDWSRIKQPVRFASPSRTFDFLRFIIKADIRCDQKHWSRCGRSDFVPMQLLETQHSFAIAAFSPLLFRPMSPEWPLKIKAVMRKNSRDSRNRRT